jgi:cytochrome c peroxidase
MNKRNAVLGFFLLFGLLISCGEKPDKEFNLIVPNGFRAPVIPKHNQLTEKKVALGQLLFFDPIVSDDSSTSCATCHIPELAFTDGKKVPAGVMGNIGTRNSPTLVNVAYYPYFFSEGKVMDLETQALAPGLHEAEMGTELKQMIYRLRKNKFYHSKFKEIFKQEIELKHFVYVIACYERTLIAANSKYDQFLQSKDSTLLSKEEKQGMNLFFSDRTQCSQCHNGNLFTDFSIQNIGLYEVYIDPGLARANSLGADSGKFKTPTLRNIEFTSPYMHDGSFTTLEEVVEFYDLGGKNHRAKSKWIKPLHLTVQEKKSLVSFLKILTDGDLKNGKGIFKTPILNYRE